MYWIAAARAYAGGAVVGVAVQPFNQGVLEGSPVGLIPGQATVVFENGSAFRDPVAPIQGVLAATRFGIWPIC